MSQTRVQQSSFSQPAVALVSQQSPLPGQALVVEHSPPHTSRAINTQSKSQMKLQQKPPSGSAQTAAQQDGSLHPGVPCTSQQSPASGRQTSSHPQAEIDCAASTHAAFHGPVQQEGIFSHTCPQHIASRHPGVSWALQQLPSPGQPPSQSGEHTQSARATQIESHDRSQQSGSSSHTA